MESDKVPVGYGGCVDARGPTGRLSSQCSCEESESTAGEAVFKKGGRGTCVFTPEQLLIGS